MNYLVFLRAVNVGGRNKIKMKELTDILTHSGFSNVRSHIQSGNFLLSTNKYLTNIELENKICELIEEEFDLNISVISFEFDKFVKDVTEIINNNISQFEIGFITYLKKEPNIDLITQIKENFNLDDYIFSERYIIGFAPDGYSKVKFNNSFFEKKLKLEATTRNFKVSKKLIELGEEIF